MRGQRLRQPGIDDNGSGTSGLLETALQLGSQPRVGNAVRFASWGSEELGLLDPCYHSACDTIDNINMFAFERNVDAVAWTVGVYATSTAGVNEAQSPGSAVGSPAAHDHEAPAA